MKDLIQTLQKRFSGYGHYKISIEIDDKVYKATTSDMQAIDAAFDEDYDLVDPSDRCYESREEAQISLINEIKRKNALD
jgi:hypothetical protein